MDHFEGITPEQRWRNDVLTELIKIRELLELKTSQFKQPEEKESVDNGNGRGRGQRQGKRRE